MTLNKFFLLLPKVIDWIDQYFLLYIYKIPGLNEVNNFFLKYFWFYIVLEKHQAIVSKVFTLWLCLLCYPFVSTIFFLVCKVLHYIFLFFKHMFFKN
ncbi:putative membrane protein [Candidatus Phytoplasma solani]|uniref:hypothetical protein n=1 Tax=Candidatus Phytoplasma solani TaxID=69896 RepID=UPI0032D9DC20